MTSEKVSIEEVISKRTRDARDIVRKIGIHSGELHSILEGLTEIEDVVDIIENNNTLQEGLEALESETIRMIASISGAK